VRRLTRVAPRTSPSATPAAAAQAAVGAIAGAPLTLTIGFEERRRSRWRARLDGGEEAAVLLPNGVVLRDGDGLVDEATGEVVTIRAAAESLSVGRTADAHLLARAAYHLGNRHIPLQIAPGSVAYQHDHVLDRMVRALGLEVTLASAPFEPEAGGYKHDGNHTHGHEHGHEHAHAPPPRRP
jgi:urease accessory protein